MKKEKNEKNEKKEKKRTPTPTSATSHVRRSLVSNLAIPPEKKNEAHSFAISSSSKSKKRNTGTSSKRLQSHAVDWLSPRGVDKGLRCAIRAMAKEELVQCDHATKRNELLGMYSPKELTSVYIMVCMANCIDYKQVDMVSEFSSKARSP